MSLDKNIIDSINEIISEANESREISKILIEWLESIDNGKNDLDTNKIIQELINRIK
jgi:hypothetical protein